MLKYKILWFLFNLKASLASYRHEVHELGFQKGKKHLSVKQIGYLPKQVQESSGLVYRTQDSTLLTHNDSGDAPHVYQIDFSGKLLNTYPIPQAKNVDWEDMSVDEQGDIYVGDIGNNSHQRRDLCVYRINKNIDAVLQKIPIHYPEKQPVPDAEAMFVTQDSIYVFTKTLDKSGTDLFVRKVGANADTLRLKAHINLRTPITGAAINPQKNKFVLISYGKIYYFRIIEHQIDFSNPLYCLNFPHKQTESIAFLDENVVIITNEQGEIYRVCEN